MLRFGNTPLMNESKGDWKKKIHSWCQSSILKWKAIFDALYVLLIFGVLSVGLSVCEQTIVDCPSVAESVVASLCYLTTLKALR